MADTEPYILYYEDNLDIPPVRLDSSKPGNLSAVTIAAERVGELQTEAVKSDAPAHRFLDQLLAEEIRRREERRTKTSLRLSGLPTGYTLADVDWAFQPSVEKSQIETLATCVQ